MFDRWRKMAKHLEQHGRRVPATVLEVSEAGIETRSEGIGLENLVPGSGGDTLVPRNSGGYMVRKAKIRIEPPDGPPVEVERKMRFGDWGRYVPKAGERIEVVYDPNDPEQVLVAPPTAEEEAIRTAEALGKADIGMTIGGGGNRPATPQPISDDAMAQHQQAMDQAQKMMEQAQQFMGGGQADQTPPAEGEDEKKREGD